MNRLHMDLYGDGLFFISNSISFSEQCSPSASASCYSNNKINENKTYRILGSKFKNFISFLDRETCRLKITLLLPCGGCWFGRWGGRICGWCIICNKYIDHQNLKILFICYCLQNLLMVQMQILNQQFACLHQMMVGFPLQRPVLLAPLLSYLLQKVSIFKECSAFWSDYLGNINTSKIESKLKPILWQKSKEKPIQSATNAVETSGLTGILAS